MKSVITKIYKITFLYMFINTKISKRFEIQIMENEKGLTGKRKKNKNKIDTGV